MRNRSCSRWVTAVLLAVTTGCAALAMRADITMHLTVSGNLKATLASWTRLSTATGGRSVVSSGARDVPGLLRRLNQEALPPGAPVDLVYVVDTTASMVDDIDAARRDMRTILDELTARHPDRHVGVVAYRDRGDDYLTLTVLQMTPDTDQIQAGFQALRVGGGGDLREHVYAGLDTALREQPWRPGASHHIVLIGDAPPHDDYRDDPRTHDSIVALAASPELQVRIHTVGVQCDALCQGLIAAGL
jgi:Mg-chelatase subunit ChlD